MVILKLLLYFDEAKFGTLRCPGIELGQEKHFY
jgi:hypothetical protein